MNCRGGAAHHMRELQSVELRTEGQWLAQTFLAGALDDFGRHGHVFNGETDRLKQRNVFGQGASSFTTGDNVG